MTTGWDEAQTGAEPAKTDEACARTRTETAHDAGLSPSDAVASLPALRGAECLASQPPEWPEKAIYVYI